MKSLKFLLFGLIFALTCSVSFAAPPEVVTLKVKQTSVQKKDFPAVAKEMQACIESIQIVTWSVREDPGILIKHCNYTENFTPTAEKVSIFYILHYIPGRYQRSPLYNLPFYGQLKKYQPANISKAPNHRRITQHRE